MVEFETLHQWLTRVHDDDHGLPFWHGYLAAVVCGPKMLMPSQWMPALLRPRGDDYVFESEDEMRQTNGLIMAAYDDVARQLMGDIFRPYLSSREDGLVQWCRGFVEGLGAWFSGLDEKDRERVTRLIGPILFYSDRETSAPELEKEFGKEDADKLFRDTPKYLKRAVPALRKYFMPGGREAADRADAESREE
ncbi:MAG: YecA family protein [Spirochaetales bacterium]|nr:YecA family protein [Spirochaetales bacterium]